MTQIIKLFLVVAFVPTIALATSSEILQKFTDLARAYPSSYACEAFETIEKEIITDGELLERIDAQSPSPKLEIGGSSTPLCKDCNHISLSRAEINHVQRVNQEFWERSCHAEVGTSYDIPDKEEFKNLSLIVFKNGIMGDTLEQRNQSLQSFSKRLSSTGKAYFLQNYLCSVTDFKEGRCEAYSKDQRLIGCAGVRYTMTQIRSPIFLAVLEKEFCGSFIDFQTLTQSAPSYGLTPKLIVTPSIYGIVYEKMPQSQAD